MTYTVLMGLDVIEYDIRNAYLQALTSGKYYVIFGHDFGLEKVGKVALITRALYGGKVAGRKLWHQLRMCMGFLGFTSSLADPDMWRREATKSTGSK